MGSAKPRTKADEKPETAAPASKVQGSAGGKRLPPNAGKGRKRGVPNRVTQEFRDTVRRLLEDNSENVGVWLQRVANGEGDTKADPGRALDLLAKLAEYAAPKLARTEVVGGDGGPVKASVEVSFV